MTTTNGNGVFPIEIEGTFDDCQNIVKDLFKDKIFNDEVKLGAINSINWGRILAQIVYYFKGYLSVTNSSDELVDFTVPTGNFGNICAGHIARMMGLPIRNLVVATNENDVLDEFFKTGKYQPRNSENIFQTSIPSMDISKASNFESFIFDLLDRDTSTLNAYWDQIDNGGSFQLDKKSVDLISVFGFISSSS